MPHPLPTSLLPNEILALFISSSDPDTLSAISLVCRLFYRLAFPLVHHTISFKQTVQVKQFIQIIKEEDEHAPLRISQALRCLKFCNELNGSGLRSVEPIDEYLLIQFKAIIPKLVELERLVWGVTHHRGSSSLFVAFQRWCPRLRSLEMPVRSSHPSGANIVICYLAHCFLTHGSGLPPRTER
jgi:hypothetical protein